MGNVVPPGKKPLIRKITSGFIFWCGLAIIGVIVMVIGILYGIVIVIGDIFEFMLKKIENDAR